MPGPFAEVSVLTPLALNWCCPVLGSVQGPIHTAMRDANAPTSPASTRIALPSGSARLGLCGDSRDLTFQCRDPEHPALSPSSVPTPSLPSAQLPAVTGVLPAPTSSPRGRGMRGCSSQPGAAAVGPVCSPPG